ncbi:MAG TPA: FAD-binding oxidoreductase [Steroidobacteraceae bacterium]|nr:FAD-binding oxidoreductase [Steroidobacteraceae bacterium]
MGTTDQQNYYYASTPAVAPFAPLRGDVRADVCIVGGGISGLSAALHLRERGYEVVLLEAEHLGFGGSGRSGGQSIFGYACEMSTLEKAVGQADARRMWDVACEGLDLQRQLIARHRIDCDYVPGHMIVGLKKRHDDALRAEVDHLAKNYGYTSLRFMEREETRQNIASDRYTSALYDSNGGHLHSYRYTRGLGDAAAAAGVAIHENSRVTKLEVAQAVGGSHLVRTSEGIVRAPHLLVAGGALLGKLVPELARKLIAIGTYIVATEPLGEDRARALVRNNAAVADMNWILDYFRVLKDTRLLFGGRVSYSGIDPLDSSRVLRQRIATVFPQLADARVEYSWGGYLDITTNRAPHFGQLGPNAYFIQGLSGHGMVIAGIAGRVASEAIAGNAERFDMYARIRHANFPGGPLFRRPALVLAMLWFRLLDLL